MLFSFIADSNSRRTMFFIVSLACHLSALFFSLFKSYTLLYIWRGISGALVTTSLPIFLSILGDIFPNSLRSTASVISSVVVGLGQLMGQTLSGFIGSRFGWRFFFQLTALLGLLSLFILRCTRPPPSSPLVVDFPYNGQADGVLAPNTAERQKNEQLATLLEPAEIETSMELEGEGMSLDTSILRDVFCIRSNWLRSVVLSLPPSLRTGSSRFDALGCLHHLPPQHPHRRAQVLHRLRLHAHPRLRRRCRTRQRGRGRHLSLPVGFLDSSHAAAPSTSRFSPSPSPSAISSPCLSSRRFSSSPPTPSSSHWSSTRSCSSVSACCSASRDPASAPCCSTSIGRSAAPPSSPSARSSTTSGGSWDPSSSSTSRSGREERYGL